MLFMKQPYKNVLIDRLHVTSMYISGKSLNKLGASLIKLCNLHICRPYYNRCDYCNVKYDVIGHLEDSLDDIMYIGTKQNLTTFLPELTKTNRKSKSKGEMSSLDRIEHYMSQLTTQQRRTLYKLYELDFELFGYDPGDALCKNEACI